jgi:Kef-type K+ transport system membrane component KefB
MQRAIRYDHPQRFTLTLLFALLLVASNFGLDVVLGAFLAGVVLRRWAPGDLHSLEANWTLWGTASSSPCSSWPPGMGLDLHSIAENPLRLLVFFVLLLGVRGLPALVLYRRLLPLPKRFEMMFLTATPLPLLVALATQCGGRTGATGLPARPPCIPAVLQAARRIGLHGV